MSWSSDDASMGGGGGGARAGPGSPPTLSAMLEDLEDVDVDVDALLYVSPQHPLYSSGGGGDPLHLLYSSGGDLDVTRYAATSPTYPHHGGGGDPLYSSGGGGSNPLYSSGGGGGGDPLYSDEARRVQLMSGMCRPTAMMEDLIRYSSQPLQPMQPPNTALPSPESPQSASCFASTSSGHLIHGLCTLDLRSHPIHSPFASPMLLSPFISRQGSSDNMMLSASCLMEATGGGGAAPSPLVNSSNLGGLGGGGGGGATAGALQPPQLQPLSGLNWSSLLPASGSGSTPGSSGRQLPSLAMASSRLSSTRSQPGSATQYALGSGGGFSYPYTTGGGGGGGGGEGTPTVQGRVWGTLPTSIARGGAGGSATRLPRVEGGAGGMATPTPRVEGGAGPASSAA